MVRLIRVGRLRELGADLNGAVIFHSAVSVAGIGPTTSNKLEIESSIPTLSAAGVRLHLGKGSLSQETVGDLNRCATIPASLISSSLSVTELLHRQVFSNVLSRGLRRVYAGCPGARWV